MLRLGEIELEYPFFQTPLSGYSDYAMRKLAKEFGCPLTFAGVMLAKSAANEKVLKKNAFRPGDDEHPVGAQILGDEPVVMAEAAKGLANVGFDIIDLNFACPAPKVLRRKRGGALLDEPQRIMEIYRQVRDAVSCPVTVKLRIGVKNLEKSKDDFWKLIEAFNNEQVDMLTIHGRTVDKKFSGDVDREILGQVKKQFPNMVIAGSGDIYSSEDVADLLKDKGLDAVAVARGAIGNPWLFAEIKAYFDSNQAPSKPSLNEVKDVMLRHFGMVCSLYPSVKAVRYFRKFLTGYCKYHPERKKVIVTLMAVKKPQQLRESIDILFADKI
ncbi:MAG: tRNA-dihydrouridine synthase [Sedimentisphaerales bacterium]|nr:tRNA-dihydrouridine synthase [Sedimentisphaerales bacterium]